MHHQVLRLQGPYGASRLRSSCDGLWHVTASFHCTLWRKRKTAERSCLACNPHNMHPGAACELRMHACIHATFQGF